MIPGEASASTTVPKVLAQSTWGTSHPDNGRSIAIGPGGRIYVAGTTFATGSSFDQYALILAYNSSGTLLWQRTWRNDTIGSWASAIAVDPVSGDIYVTGGSTVTGGGGGASNAFVLKFDSSGNTLWQEHWTALYSRGSAITVDGSANVYVAGNTINQFFLLKLDPAGRIVWQLLWTPPLSSYYYDANTLSVDSFGNVYLSADTYPSSGYNVDLLKFSPTGSLVWQKTWGGLGSDKAEGGTIDSANHFYVTGSTTSYIAGSKYPFLLKIDSSGSIVWQKIWVGNCNCSFQAVALDSYGNIYVAGNAGAWGGGILLLKLDATSALVWATTWGGEYVQGQNRGMLGSLAVDSAGNAVITGQIGPPPYALGLPGNSSFRDATFGLTSLTGSVSSATLPGYLSKE